MGYSVSHIDENLSTRRVTPPVLAVGISAAFLLGKGARAAKADATLLHKKMFPQGREWALFTSPLS